MRLLIRVLSALRSQKSRKPLHKVLRQPSWNFERWKKYRRLNNKLLQDSYMNNKLLWRNPLSETFVDSNMAVKSHFCPSWSMKMTLAPKPKQKFRSFLWRMLKVGIHESWNTFQTDLTVAIFRNVRKKASTSSHFENLISFKERRCL